MNLRIGNITLDDRVSEELLTQIEEYVIWIPAKRLPACWRGRRE